MSLTVAQLHQAACRQEGVDPSWFYYGKGVEATKADMIRFEDAALVCSRCPIRDACLKEGMDVGDWSFRGGKLLRNGHIQILEPGPGAGYKLTEEHKKAYVVAYVDKWLGTACRRNHPRTKEIISATRGGDKNWQAFCLICQRVNAGYDNWINPWSQCEEGHWLVPENQGPNGCIACTRGKPPANGSTVSCKEGHRYPPDVKYRSDGKGSKVRVCEECDLKKAA